MAPTVAFLTARGVPVIGHVGLTPQAVNVLGGYGARGQDGRSNTHKIVGDARSHRRRRGLRHRRRGASSSRWRAPSPRAVACPTIGIGASPACDGQVLVVDDMLGMFERVPALRPPLRRSRRPHRRRRCRLCRRRCAIAGVPRRRPSCTAPRPKPSGTLRTVAAPRRYGCGPANHWRLTWRNPTRPAPLAPLPSATRATTRSSARSTTSTAAPSSKAWWSRFGRAIAIGVVVLLVALAAAAVLAGGARAAARRRRPARQLSHRADQDRRRAISPPGPPRSSPTSSKTGAPGYAAPPPS